MRVKSHCPEIVIAAIAICGGFSAQMICGQSAAASTPLLKRHRSSQAPLSTLLVLQLHRDDSAASV
jgi:hypothetical protein